MMSVIDSDSLTLENFIGVNSTVHFFTLIESATVQRLLYRL
jgi:hypothetical protein